MSHATRDTIVYVVLRLLFEIGCRLPLAVNRVIGRMLIRVVFLFLGRDRRRMREHIKLAFPDDDEREVARLMRRCVDHFGQVLGEVVWLWRARPEAIERLVEIDGLEHLAQPIEERRGAILVSGHIGNWELLNARMSVAGVPYMLAVRELDDPRLNSIITGLRTRFGARVILRGQSAGRQLSQALRDGDGVGLLIDQDIPKIPGVFVPFFGRPARTPSGAAMLALKTGSPIVTGFIHRRPDGSHKIVISPPLPRPTRGTLEEQVTELTATATAAIEWQVRAWPEQWVWMHRRWRSRPDDDGVAGSAAETATESGAETAAGSGTATAAGAGAEACSEPESETATEDA